MGVVVTSISMPITPRASQGLASKCELPEQLKGMVNLMGAFESSPHLHSDPQLLCSNRGETGKAPTA